MARFRLLSNALVTPSTGAIILRSLFWSGILVLVVVSVIPRDYLPPPGFDTYASSTADSRNETGRLAGAPHN